MPGRGHRQQGCDAFCGQRRGSGPAVDENDPRGWPRPWAASSRRCAAVGGSLVPTYDELAQDMRRPPPGGRAGAVCESDPGGMDRTHHLPAEAGTPSGCTRGASVANVRAHHLAAFCRLYARGVADPAPQRTSVAVPHRTAAFFDLDKTIIAKSSTLAFSRSVLPRRADQPAGRAAQRVRPVRLPRRRRRPRPDGTDARVPLGDVRRAGTSQQVKEIVAETLHDLIDPIIYDEAATLIEEHHVAGRDVVIVSTSGAEVVEPIGELLGADHVIATRMVVEDGQLHRRDRVLRLRRDQGRGDPRARRGRGLRPRSAATPTATRSPTCRCSRPSGTRTR